VLADGHDVHVVVHQGGHAVALGQAVAHRVAVPAGHDRWVDGLAGGELDRSRQPDAHAPHGVTPPADLVQQPVEGLLGGFAGVSAQVGDGLEFQAITAVMLGGVVLGGGRGSVVAAIAGALTLEALFTLLNLLGVSGALEDAVEGLIIIAAVAFAAFRLRADR
jgi:ribose transport system permease protein